MHRLLAVAALSFLAGCGAAAPPVPAAPPRPASLARGDAGATLAAVAEHYERLGWKIVPDPAQQRIVLTSPKGSKFGLGAYVGSKGELSHVVMFKAFMPKPEAKGTPQLTALVAALSNKVNGVIYQVSEDGAVVCATWVYYLDHLDPLLVTRTLELLDQVGVAVIAAQSPDLLKLLR